MSVAECREMMAETIRSRSFLFAASVLALGGVCMTPSSASAQSSINITSMVRSGSPRVVNATGGVIPTTDPIGLRDCPCETWTMLGNFTAASDARYLEWWVGTTAEACSSSTNRMPGLSTTTCWQIPQSAVPSLIPVAGNNNISVSIPSRWLVDPINGACTPPPGRSNTGVLYLSPILRPPDDGNVQAQPVSLRTINYNRELPVAPVNVTAEAGEGVAQIRWGSSTTTTDAGSSTAPATNIRGYYVLCFPNVPSGFDAGTTTSTCDAGSGLDASSTDTGTTMDADTTDSGGSMDAGTNDASTSDGSTSACESFTLPAGFDTNNEAQFRQYQCSAFLQDRTLSSYQVTGLNNGTTYRFAVVAEDTAGNRSNASTITACVTPKPVTDFWEHYRNNGGGAMPGFCSVATPGRASERGLFWLLVAGVTVAVIRRARRGDR